MYMYIKIYIFRWPTLLLLIYCIHINYKNKQVKLLKNCFKPYYNLYIPPFFV